MRSSHLSILSVAFLTTAGLAHAAGACPYAAAGWPDGCAGAPASGAYQQSAFGTYARQSGQTWVSAHPQPWDVAGWDYAVGYSKVAAPGFYPLARPDLATRGGTASGANLPYTSASSGCAYSATGNPGIPGAPVILCYGLLPANGTGAYAGKIVISGIDFSADSAGHCVQLYVDNAHAGQTLYVVNNNFRKGPGCYQVGTNNGDALLNMVGSADSLVVLDNVFDGAAPYLLDQANLLSMDGTGTVDVEYNAFLNSAARAVNGDGRAGWTLKYNYIDGIAIGATAPHGEVAGTFPNDSGATIAYQDDEFNTVVWGAATTGSAGVNAAMFLSGGGGGQTLALGKLVGNNLVSNLEFAGVVSAGKAIMSVEIPFVQNLIVQNNYADPSGSWLCMQVEGDEIALAGYIDDGKGAGGAYDGVPGNVMHVTARRGKDFIVRGAQLFQILGTGLPGNPSIVGAVGYVCNGVTMNGSTTSTRRQTSPYATYCLSGPAKAVKYFYGVQTMPQIRASTVSGNVNLRDGTAITPGTNLQWNNGSCSGRA